MRHFPDSHVFYRRLTRGYPLIVRGDGCWLYGEDGREYLDAAGGAMVANVGHGVAEIAEAMAEQAARVAYVNGTQFTNAAVEKLADEVAAMCGPPLSLVYPLGSGSEAVEAALKLVRQYWLERGRPAKRRIIALSPSYHGNTLLALSASARAHYAAHIRDWLVDIEHVPAPYTYRCTCGGSAPLCDACSGAAIEEAMLRLGPETVAAVIAEPVGGSSTGASVPPSGYWRSIRELCDRHEVLLIADEVLTGAGRTGSWSAIGAWDVVPDVMVLGKGIAGGYAPLSAVVTSPRIASALAEGSGGLMHAQTFSHHAVCCAAGVATIRYLKREGLIARSRTMGEVLHQKLSALRALPHVGDVRGRGLLAGVELVADVDSRKPFDRSAKVAESLAAAALDAGLVVWPNVGHADGTNGDLVMIAPPFVVTDEEIDEIVERLGRAIEITVDRMKRPEAVGTQDAGRTTQGIS